jgi:RecJ-like exonuclease
MAATSDSPNRDSSVERKPMAPGDEAPPGTPGTGETVCPRCGGSGSVQGTSCPECLGRGKVTHGVGGG